MRSNRTRFLLTIMGMALAAQLAFVVPTARAGQNANSSTTTTTTTTTVTRRRGRGGVVACRQRCWREYRLCTRGFAPPHIARCRERLRRCLRGCQRY